jgi:hypothetical protein
MKFVSAFTSPKVEPDHPSDERVHRNQKPELLPVGAQTECRDRAASRAVVGADQVRHDVGVRLTQSVAATPRLARRMASACGGRGGMSRIMRSTNA